MRQVISWVRGDPERLRGHNTADSAALDVGASERMRGSNLLAVGGVVVTPEGSRRSDIRIREGIVVEIAANLRPDGDPVIDATGCHVLPGVIDAHSHQWERGSASRHDFRDDTASAAIGGITTILDHPLTTPEVLDADRLRSKAAIGERTAFVDFALHGGASPDTLDGLEGLWRAGATAIKFFTCKTGAPMAGFITPEQQRDLLTRLSTLGALAMVHAEANSILDANRTRMVANGHLEASRFGDWRSPEAESRAVIDILEIAQQSGTAMYVVHASQPEAVSAVVDARARGQLAFAETCPHYLILTDDDIRSGGHRFTTSPPVRDLQRTAGLHACLDTSIDVVGSDHSPVALDRKSGDVFSGQPGIPSNEIFVPLMLDLVAGGVLTLERLVSLWSANPAAIFGVDEHKGRIGLGVDGDLTIVDLEGQTTVRAGHIASSAGWSPYEGRTMRGRVRWTIVRGTPVAEDGTLRVEPGHGTWNRRAGTH